MTTCIHSAIPFGLNAKLIEVECDSSRGLPAFNIVGMPSKVMSEARDRVRSAIKNTDLIFPPSHITINLAPAELPKYGTFLDLPIALSIITISHQLLPTDTQGKAFIGELSLDGRVKPVQNIIGLLEGLKNSQIKEVYIPVDNLKQASMVPDIQVYGVDTLLKLILHLKGQRRLITPDNLNFTTPKPKKPTLTLNNVYGQQHAKRALQIAIAGHHNILLTGPPGTGKTMLANASASLLSPLDYQEQIELTKIYSLANLTTDIVTSRPFRAPHSSASKSAILGGALAPGEITLAHRGILFLDELPEFGRDTIESLRQPLEDHTIQISRTGLKQLYPANFTLVATMNPCPCGYYGSDRCTCSKSDIKKYQSKLSGPLLDRIDMIVQVSPESTQTVLSPPDTTDYKTSVRNAELTAINRYRVPNALVKTQDLLSKTRLTTSGKQYLLQLKSSSNRSLLKLIRIARTIADLEQSEIISEKHLLEAEQFTHKIFN